MRKPTSRGAGKGCIPLVLALLSASTPAQQIICSTPDGGKTTYCNGPSAGSTTQPPDASAPYRAAAEQQKAQAAQMAAQAEMLQAAAAARAARTREQLANDRGAQAELQEAQRRLDAQREALAASSPQAGLWFECRKRHGWSEDSAQVCAKEALAVPAAAGTATPEQVRASVATDSTASLKAKAATFEAVMRSTPPDSAPFRNAVAALAAVNEELAKRGEIK